MKKEWKYGDKINWTEGSQMDMMTYDGIVIKSETVLTVMDKNGEKHKLTVESYKAEIKKGWEKK